tara:strand:+ start:176 stop:400 length:225 start_codon:yes stop_codon:yes gene_type:complete
MFKLINNREPKLGQRQLGFKLWIFKLLFCLHKFAGKSVSVVFSVHNFRVSFMIGTTNVEDLFMKTKRKGKTYDA